MKVGIVGAGSIGLWFAGRLADAGVDVSVLARGRTLSALTAGGVNVQSNDSSLKANVTVSKLTPAGPSRDVYNGQRRDQL